MSETQDAQDTGLAGFVPESETPTEETPPVEAAPEEQTVESEKPAETNSEETAVEDDSGKTPEQRAEDAKHWQTEYQKLKASRDEALKELTDPTQDVLADDSSPKTAAEIVTEKGPELSPEKVDGMTDDQLNEMLREDPILAMRVMQEQTVHTFRDEIAKQAQTQEAQRNFQLEKDRANAALNRYIDDNNVSADEIAAAKKSLDALGVKAAPRGIAAMLIKDIENRRIQQHLSERTQQVAAETSQQVKQQALTVQPEAGKPAPPQPKTVEEAIVEKFGPSKEKTVVDGFFE
jgi:hypothetical protein